MRKPLDDFYVALRDDDAEALYERAPCGYLSTTPDGLIIKINQTLLTWLGRERDEVVRQRSFIDLLSPGGRIYHETHYAPTLRMQGMAREIALELVCADGSRLPVLANAVLERDERGEPRVIRTAIFDATERREYERELLRSKRRAEESEAHARLLARTLQQTLIPPAPPQIPGLDIAAVYRPAGTGEEVGGDFYDVFEIGDGAWVVAVGDVRGKGVDAAVVTALARYTVRAAAVRHDDPAQVLAVLNTVLLHDESDRTCTMALLRLNRDDEGWTVTSCSAGHPLPLRRAARTGLVAPVGRPGMLLGAFDDVVLVDSEEHLGPGDLVVLYTDGVSEARQGRVLFGDAAVSATIVDADGEAGGLARTLVDQVLAFQDGDARDDIVVVVARVPG